MLQLLMPGLCHPTSALQCWLVGAYFERDGWIRWADFGKAPYIRYLEGRPVVNYSGRITQGGK